MRRLRRQNEQLKFIIYVLLGIISAMLIVQFTSSNTCDVEENTEELTKVARCYHWGECES